jgi:hypothetical protein
MAATGGTLAPELAAPSLATFPHQRVLHSHALGSIGSLLTCSRAAAPSSTWLEQAFYFCRWAPVTSRACLALQAEPPACDSLVARLDGVLTELADAV